MVLLHMSMILVTEDVNHYDWFALMKYEVIVDLLWDAKWILWLIVNGITHNVIMICVRLFLLKEFSRRFLFLSGQMHQRSSYVNRWIWPFKKLVCFINLSSLEDIFLPWNAFKWIISAEKSSGLEPSTNSFSFSWQKRSITQGTCTDVRQ